MSKTKSQTLSCYWGFLFCVFCSKCNKCGFISYCSSEKCREADYENHYPICSARQQFFLRGGYHVGTTFLMLVNQKRAMDKKYEFGNLYLIKLESLDNLVAVLITLEQSNEYVRIDMAECVRWMLCHIDSNHKIRKCVQEF